MSRGFRRRLFAVVAAAAVLVAGLVVPSAPAAAAVLDPAFPSNWPRYTFHAGTAYPMVMDAAYEGGHGSAVWLWEYSGSAAQIWVWETADEGGGYYHPGYNRNLCLDFVGEHTGGQVQVRNCDGSASQRWFPEDNGSAIVIYTHSDHKYCIDIPSSNSTSGQQLQVWPCNGTAAQRWLTGRTFPTTWPRWSFHSAGRYDQVVDVSYSGGDGAPVQLWTTNRSDAQIWYEEVAGGYSYLHPAYDRGLCLARDSEGWGGRLTVRACRGTTSQRWQFRFAGNQVELRAYGPDLCVDVPSSDFSSGRQLQIWDCNGSAAQRWPVGQCNGADCMRRNPEAVDCGTAGTRTVSSFTTDEHPFFYSTYVELRWAFGCNAVYARIPGKLPQHEVQIRRYFNGSYEYFSGSDQGGTEWTPMFPVQSGYRYRACIKYIGRTEYVCDSKYWP